MLLGALGRSLLRNILAGRGINGAGEGAIATRQGRRLVKASYRNKKSRENNKMDF